MPAVTTKYDARGPVFISYRHSDGEKIADRLAWLLRAAGIPVWRDKEDLTTGSIEARIEEAMGKGLSGGVLVVTPDVENSEIIQTLEATGLLDLLENNPEFSLTVVNALPDGDQLDLKAPPTAADQPPQNNQMPNGKQLDPEAPGRVLDIPKRVVKKIVQFPATLDGLSDSDQKQFITAYVKDHLTALQTNDGPVELNIDSYNDPPNEPRAVHDLDIYLRKPKKDEAISRQGLEDLQAILEIIGDCIPAKKASLTAEGHPKASLRVSGYAHLPIIFALGAQFPTTRNSYAEVDDDGMWFSSRNPTESEQFVTVADHGEDPSSSSNEVAVYVDLNNKKAIPINPSNTENRDPFAMFREDKQGQLRAWRHLRLVNPRDICTEDGNAIAKQATDLIQELSEIHGKGHVHLFMQCPFALAFLIGRRTNTLTFTTYAYDIRERRYVPALEVHTTGHGGVIKEVLAPESTQQS